MTRLLRHSSSHKKSPKRNSRKKNSRNRHSRNSSRYRSAITPSSFPREGGGNALFIIDPQYDFHEGTNTWLPDASQEGGTLAVPGSNESAQNMATFINNNVDKISNIVVSLDTHSTMHIGNPAYWKNAESNAEPPDLTPITFVQGVFKDEKNVEYTTRYPEDREWAEYYCKELQKRNKTHMIWPYHCITGSKGAAIVKPIEDALRTWSKKHKRDVFYVLKGMNNKTEMYSALKAEVIDPEDPRTQINMPIINFLKTHNKVFVGGQAKTHCVYETVKDLVSYWNCGRDTLDSKIILLEDTTNNVPGFEDPVYPKSVEFQKHTFTLSDNMLAFFTSKGKP